MGGRDTKFRSLPTVNYSPLKNLLKSSHNRSHLLLVIDNIFRFYIYLSKAEWYLYKFYFALVFFSFVIRVKLAFLAQKDYIFILFLK